MNENTENCFAFDGLIADYSNKTRKIKKKLLLNYTDLINRTICSGGYDFPKLLSPSFACIDYLALYKDRKEYCRTSHTCVCFYEFDSEFDGKNGLFNAIYYSDKRQLDKFKERFKDVRYFISPDYSIIGDSPEAMNIYNIFKARIVSLWLTIECGKLVIPNITYSTEKSFEYAFDGLEDCQIVAFSCKGSLRKQRQKALLKKAIEATITKLTHLKQIVVYDVSRNNSLVNELFSCALKKGIEIIVPNNKLKYRNIILGGLTGGQI